MSTKTLNVKFQSCRHQHSKEDSHEPEFFEANVTVDYSLDKNYGADTDNQRGVEKLFINEIKVHACLDGQATLVDLPLSEKMMDDIWECVWENFEA